MFASDEPAVQEVKPLTPAQRYGLESLEAALQAEGKASVHVDVWRDHFYEKSTADSQEGKKKAFQRVRTDLKEIGKIFVTDDFYSTSAITGTAGHKRDISGTCPGDHSNEGRDNRDTLPLGSVPSVPSRSAGVVA